MDIAGAFDRVSHVGLLHKVRSLGIDGPLQRRLGSYLDTRSLQCLVGGRTSASYTTSAGVPQGSILGPTLFLAYVNDAPDVLADGASLEAYADDTTLYSLVTSQQTPEVAAQSLQVSVDRLHEWGRTWK